MSIRLNAVVCELAMLPEMFSSANDCARMPATDVVSAPKIPMTIVSSFFPGGRPDVFDAQAAFEEDGASDVPAGLCAAKSMS